MKKVFLLFFFCGFVYHSLQAQVQVINRGSSNDSTRPVSFSAERLTNTKIDSVKAVTIAVGKAYFTDRSTKFYCDSAVYREPEEIVEAFGHVHIVDKDTVNAYGDYMIYYKLDKTALLKKHVKMTDGKVILTTDEFEYNTMYKTGIYRNGGKIVNGKTVLTSRDAIYYSDIKDAYFKNDVKLRDPQYDVDTDSLLYNTQSQIATFITKTHISIKDSSGVKDITTSEGYYDLKNKKAHLGKRPVIKDGTSEITGDNVWFDDATGENNATGNAVYKDTAQGIAILANKLQGNKFTNTMLATEQPLMILKQGKDSTYISADTLFSGMLSDLVAMQDSLARLDSIAKSIILAKADSLAALRALAQRQAMAKRDSLAAKDAAINEGLAAKTDSSGGSTDSLNKNKLLVKKDSLMANDSLHINDLFVKKDSLAARDSLLKPDLFVKKAQPGKKDTLMIGNKLLRPIDVNKAAKDSTNNKRYILGYHNVRIFSDSSQAICDSLFYSGADSIFRLITNPIVWASNSQITGDTIYLYTANKKPSRFYVFENGIVINKLDDGYYNQLQGHTINGYFKDGEIDYVRSKGSAESIYYAQDEGKAYVGVNRATGDIIDIRFVNKEVNKVVFISDVSGTMYPFRQVNQEEMRLKNFKWLDEYRPKTKFELFEPPVKSILKDKMKKEKDDENEPPATKTESSTTKSSTIPANQPKPIVKPDTTARSLLKPEITIKKDTTNYSNIKADSTIKKTE